VIPFFAAGK